MGSSNTPANSAQGLKTTLIGIVFSAFLAVIKALGGILGHSYALIADAIESTADIFTSSMLWLGLKWSVNHRTKNILTDMEKLKRLLQSG